jgi:AcrR family transcriptional regulator
MLNPEVQAAFKRRRIADAMAELCGERGYRATTISDVAHRAQVGRGTIYEHFENRERIFLSVLDGAIAEVFERVETACSAAGDDSAQRVEAGLAAMLAWVAAEPIAARACFVESLRATPESFRRYLEAIAEFTSLLRGALPSEVPRPETTEESLVGGVAAILSGLVRADQTESAPEMLPSLSIFLRGPFLRVGLGPA